MLRRKALAMLAAVAVSLIIVLPASAFAQEFRPYQSPDGTFRCVLPEGWSIVESPSYSREVSKVDGFNAYTGGFEDRVTISIHYHPEGNLLHKDMDIYIKRHSQPILGIQEGQSYEKVRDLDFKGTKARTFERTEYEYESHVYNPKLGRYVEPLHPRKTQYRERFIVMPVKSGFVAFRFKARPDMVRQYEDVFARVADSFALLVK